MVSSLDFLWRSLLMGFAIAAPVGPIGLLCIQRTLNHGQRHGLVSGLGAATADALYGCVAGFGLTFISTFLVDQKFWLGAVGGLFLCCLGVRTLRSTPVSVADQVEQRGLLNAYSSTLFLTLTNPMTIFSFVGVFAGLGLAQSSGNYTAALILVVGVFAGSAAWWLLLSSGVALFRSRFNQSALQWVNWIAGAVIVGFGLFTLVSLWS